MHGLPVPCPSTLAHLAVCFSSERPHTLICVLGLGFCAGIVLRVEGTCWPWERPISTRPASARVLFRPSALSHDSAALFLLPFRINDHCQLQHEIFPMEENRPAASSHLHGHETRCPSRTCPVAPAREWAGCSSKYICIYNMKECREDPSSALSV
ncbi:hypothetical protein B0T25DRAFT_523849 [Lasiosphaeria hispida]|uniref:Uncharacterized protein n=1 Tax=Lasiosphaeria hispida TaxID=260671 RepID=A0AAJ0HT84_9PEZI|nr:hypothetical protein B0T25DRAFT_523849 [Lasiosphaeria hispida]